MHTSAIALLLLAPAQPPSQPVDVKPAVEKGLNWLAEQQQEDGRWVGRADAQPTSTTAVAGLALLMEGSTLRNGTYAEHLQKAIAWMEKIAQPSGRIASEHRTEARYMPAHAHAILFLACAYDVDDDPKRRVRIKAILERAVTYTGEAQTNRGGWATVSARDGNSADDITTSVHMYHALLTARKVGIEVPRKITDKAGDYLAKAIVTAAGNRVPLDDDIGMFAQTTNTLFLTTGVSAAMLSSDSPRPAAQARWLRFVQGTTLQPWPRRPTSMILLTHYNLARVRYALGETGHAAIDANTKAPTRIQWSMFRDPTYQAIIAAQSGDGSWVDTVPGPVYGSALALIVLQLENEYVSAFAR